MKRPIRLNRALAPLLATLLTGTAAALEVPEGGSLLISLDATAADPQLTLAGDTVLGWGSFSLMKTNSLPPVLTTEFGGVQAVRFYNSGDSHLRSNTDVPADVTGGGAFTVEAWVCSTNLWDYGALLSWGNDLGTGCAVLGYGQEINTGAIRHSTDNAFNLGYIGFSGNAPAPGEWHHLAAAYSGAAVGQRRECLYVDGVLTAGKDTLVLNTEAGTRFHLGTLFRASTSGFIQRYNGAIARVRLYKGTLSPSQIAANYNEERADFGRSAIAPALNVFEGTGAWTDALHWSRNALPASDERILVAGDAQVAAELSAPADLHVSGTLALSGTDARFQTDGATYVGYGAGALRLSDGAAFTAGTDGSLSLAVGYRREGVLSATNASLTVSEGTFSVGYGTQGIGSADLINATGQFANVCIGHLTTADGTLHVEGGSLAASGTFYIGESATGRMTVENARVRIGGAFVAGHNTGGTGAYEQTGGTLDFRGNTVIGSGANANGSMVLTDVLLTCTNNNAFTVANATGALAATNCTFLLTDFNVANPIGGAKGSAEVVDSLVAARTITAANLTNAIGHLSFNNCCVTSRTVYVGCTDRTDGWLGIDRGCITSLTFYAGQNAGATGAIALADGSIEAASAFYAGYNGHGVFSNFSGIVRAPTVGVSFNASTASGYLYNGPGSRIETSDVFQVGRYGAGTLDCYGDISSHGTRGLYIGNLAGAEGVFNLYAGGTVSVQQTLVLGYTAGSGTYNQYGGQTVVTSATHIAYNTSASQGTLNLYGGTYTANNAIFCGYQGTGVLNIAAGLLIIPSHSLTIGYGAHSSGTCLLTGGRFVSGFIKRDNGIGTLYFDGGVLSPDSDQTDFIRNLTAAEIRTGGAVIDTDGHNVTIAQSLAHDSRDGAAAKDGGLTKRGAGVLAFTGTLGFTGDLGADGGTLDLDAATYTPASGSGLWGSGTLIPPSGGLDIPADGWIAPGSTNGAGTLAVNGNLTLNGELRIRINPEDNTCSTLAVSGSLVLPAGASVVIDNPEDMAENVSYTFADLGALNGTPAFVNLPSKWTGKTVNNQLRAVYFSGTLVTLH